MYCFWTSWFIRIGSKLFDEQLLLDFLDHKPEKLEVILTGQGPSEALIERADYVFGAEKNQASV